MSARKCKACQKWCTTHENTPKILIDPDTAQPHKCDPKLQIVRDGKWKGYSYAEMSRLWWNKKMADKNVELDI